MLSKISKTTQQINGRVGILTQDSKFITTIIESIILFLDDSRLLFQRSLLNAYKSTV